MTHEELMHMVTTVVQQAVKEVVPVIIQSMETRREEHRFEPEEDREERQVSLQDTPSRIATSQGIDLETQVEELRDEMKRLKEKGGGFSGLDRGTPFSTDIVEELLPKYYKAPQVGEYDGRGDPEEHLGRFENAAMLHCFSDRIKCKVFLTTLVRAAQQWFNQLEPRSITSFQKFSKAFLQHFGSSKKYKKTTLSLFEIKRKEAESLRDYTRRFNTTLLEVPICPSEIQVSAYTQGLRGGDLFRSLIKKPPVNFEELLGRTEKYINVEEALKYQGHKGKEVEKGSRSGEKRQIDDRRLGRFSQYTPLKVTKERAMEICQQEEALHKRPRQDKGKAVVGGKYCTYHKEGGHDTEECHKLGRELERAINNNPKIKEFLTHTPSTPRPAWRGPGLPWIQRDSTRRWQKHTERRPDRNHKEPSHNSAKWSKSAHEDKPPRGVINMISGGSTDGDSNRARKAWGRQECFSIHGAQNEDKAVITFGPEDLDTVSVPHNDALVIRAMIANYEVARVFVDSGSSVNIIFQDALDRMDLKGHQLEKINTALFGFAGHTVYPKGQIVLPLTMGTGRTKKTNMVIFTVVDAPSAYNVILGRPALNAFQAIASTYHQRLKFPVGHEVGIVKGDQPTARQCYATMVRRDITQDRGTKTNRGVKRGREEVNYLEEIRTGTEQGIKEVIIVPGYPERTTRLATDLDDQARQQLLSCLQKHADVFAWNSRELTGIPNEIAEHRLNIRQGSKPVRQKQRHFGPQKDQVIAEHVQTLLDAGHIREVQFPTWLSNVVLVPKATGKWRMCIDFRDLNKACPKDCYPLPRIDQLVDSTVGYEWLCFMDAYQGYHQIPLAMEDQEKVSFITAGGTFCYVVMPFGLKNAGATYQRLMDKIFSQQVGRNVEVYVDDILVKSRTSATLVQDLEETLITLKTYGMRLNPAKCTFGVTRGKFLGYIVTDRGIEVNPEKIQAIQNMSSPKTIRDVQRLTGRIAALSRFISRSAHRSYPFFKVLRKARVFQWDDTCEAAFLELKAHLAQLPILVKPEPGERLWVYLSATEHAVSSVLIRQNGTNQQPIYYVSHALKDVETRYTEVEKLALALITTARRLRPYFLSHPITVLTNSSIGRIMTQPDISGRLVKWTIELGEYDITYQPRTAIKGQALSDFLAEMIKEDSSEVWKVHVDGASNKSGSGVGVVLLSPQGEKLKVAVRLDYNASNNEAEYEAVLVGLKAAKNVGASRVIIYSDSQLVAQQLAGTYETKNERLNGYIKVVRCLAATFEEWRIIQIPREQNEEADSLAKMATSLTVLSNQDIIYQVELLPSTCNDTPPPEKLGWMTPLLAYIRQHELPEDPLQAIQIKKRALRFVLIQDVLYKRSFSQPLLRCLSEEESPYVLREIHEGCCGGHLGAVALSRKALLAGYWWPTMAADALHMVQRCKGCQRHAPLSHQPATLMQPVLAACPFDQWGIDIIGPFPIAPSQKKFILLAVDYFSKWVEAEPLARITEADVLRFLWKNIVCRYGIPRKLISDNGRQFQGSRITAWCTEMKIQQAFTSVAYPQANGQTEVTNRIIVDSLKTRLVTAGKDWVDELPSVLWAYRTTPRTPTGETPFSMVYGSEAVLPAEIGQSTARILAYDAQVNSERRALDLDMIEERRDAAQVRMESYRRRIICSYNRRVRFREFQVGDLVLKKSEPAGDVRKLAPKWEGPYKVTKKCTSGSYYLEDNYGRALKRPWNVYHLKKFYP